MTKREECSAIEANRASQDPVVSAVVEIRLQTRFLLSALQALGAKPGADYIARLRMGYEDTCDILDGRKPLSSKMRPNRRLRGCPNDQPHRDRPEHRHRSERHRPDHSRAGASP